jgi:hypothetical protein
MSKYYILEHPKHGTLVSLDETETGQVGRFKWSGMRSDEDVMRFSTSWQAVEARSKITRPFAADCHVRESDNWDVVA